MKSSIRIVVLVVLTVAVVSSGLIVAAQEESGKLPGFTDTPYLPDGKWRVHDAHRPRPQIITPGTFSSQEKPGVPPSDATVLFDGTDLSAWQAEGVGDEKGKIVEPAWRIVDGAMEVVPGTGSIFTKQKFGDCQIHVEWSAPTEVIGDSQGRGNSGVLIMGQYEVQVLDSYDNMSYADGQAGAMYGQYPPLVNATKKPGEWQVYDIIFEAPRFDGDDLVSPARVTVMLNGVVLHHRQAFIGSVVWRQVAKYTPHDPEGPLMLQNHSNPVRFRNIWVRPLGTYDSK